MPEEVPILSKLISVDLPGICLNRQQRSTAPRLCVAGSCCASLASRQVLPAYFQDHTLSAFGFALESGLETSVPITSWTGFIRAFGGIAHFARTPVRCFPDASSWSKECIIPGRWPPKSEPTEFFSMRKKNGRLNHTSLCLYDIRLRETSLACFASLSQAWEQCPNMRNRCDEH